MTEHYINILPSSGGGGTPAPTNPSSFSDAKALFKGNGAMTFVDGLLDTWENEGTDGGDASASATTNRIGISSSLGVGGYRNLQPWGKVNFYGTGFNTGSITQFTFEGITTMWNTWNPERITTSVGTVNANNYPCLVWVGNGGLRLTQRVSGTSTTTYWSRAGAGLEVGKPFSYTIVYDGTEAVNADRMKCYINGVFVASTTTPTHPTSVTNGNGSFWITSSHTSYSSFAEIGGYVGYWERVLTGLEIAENQTWKEQIWDVAP